MMSKISAIEAKILTAISTYIPNPSKHLKAMILAQLAHESGEFTCTEENLNYSAKRLIEVFPQYFSSKDASFYANRPEMIANRVYANRMGNGAATSGDGYRYRGRGFIQLTGKDNYLRFGLYKTPEVLSVDVDEDIRVSLEFLFSRKGFKDAADKGDVYTCTKLVNGGLIGLHDRKERYNYYMTIL